VGGAAVLDGQNAEGLTAQAAARTGRHTETIGYIKSVFAAKKKADLIAWEQKLPDLLQELDPPSKSKSKTKSKRKGKMRCSSAAAEVEIREVLEETQPDCCVEGQAVDVDSSAETKECETDERASSVNSSSDSLDTWECDAGCEGPWMQVESKGIVKPILSIASHACATEVQPPPLQSPMGSLATPGPMTPLSPQSTTPCVMSPFGRPSVLPPWPSTPESWPQLDGDLGSAAWPFLPPAANPNEIDAALPTKLASELQCREATLSDISGMAGHCQSVFVVPWWPHQLTGDANRTGWGGE